MKSQKEVLEEIKQVVSNLTPDSDPVFINIRFFRIVIDLLLDIRELLVTPTK